jgi:telomere length regulation protein
MFVGIAISQLTDKPDMRMTFSMDVANSTEAKWYLSLTGVKDSIGSIQILKKYESRNGMYHSSRNRNHISEVLEKGKSVESKVITIEEIDDEGGVDGGDDDDDDDDDDLVPYQKPDSDEEDDDDPTTVQRNKPTAPV